MFIEFFALNDPQRWLATMADQLSVSVINDEIRLPANIGQGAFKGYYPCEWLTVTYLRFKVHKPMRVQRRGEKKGSLVPIVFYLADSEQFVDEQCFHVGSQQANGIFMPSPEIDSTWIFPANQWITNLTLTFNRERLVKELEAHHNTYLYELLTEEKPFYIFESFTPPLLEVIRKIEECITKEMEPMHHFFVYEHAFSLFNRFMTQLNQRLYPELKCRLHPADVEALFKVRKEILDHISAPPSLNILTEVAAMSVSKLQKTFKQVFGKSISQYALHEKMEMAKTLLATGRNSVTEVGYQLGYSNLSHFSKAFYKEYQIHPSRYMKEMQRVVST